MYHLDTIEDDWSTKKKKRFQTISNTGSHVCFLTVNRITRTRCRLPAATRRRISFYFESVRRFADSVVYYSQKKKKTNPDSIKSCSLRSVCRTKLSRKHFYPFFFFAFYRLSEFREIFSEIKSRRTRQPSKPFDKIVFSCLSFHRSTRKAGLTEYVYFLPGSNFI